jgi:predicted permease
VVASTGVQSVRWERLRAIAKDALNPPIIGSLVGLCVGLLPFVRALLFRPHAPAPVAVDNGAGDLAGGGGGTLLGLLASRPPLEMTVTSALRSLGGTVSTLVALVLGSSIADSSASIWQAFQAQAQPEQGLEEAAQQPLELFVKAQVALGMRPSLIAAVAVVRLLVMPLCAMAAVALGARVGLVDPRDPVMLIVLLINGCTPSAMNLQLITEISGKGGAAMAKVLCITYLASIFTLTGWISVFLKLISSGTFA